MLRKAGKIEEAADLILSVPPDPKKIAELDEWWAERRELAYGALKLTDSARGVLRGETEVWLREEREGARNRAIRTKARRGDLAAVLPGRNGGADPALHAALKAWRSETARKRGVPAYVVLHDSTLDGIAAVRPATLAELRGIAGIGDKKLEHYGEELLALVKAGG